MAKVKVSVEAVAKSNKEFYVQSGEIELKRAVEFLHDNCDSWNEDCENTFRELIGKVSAYLERATAIDELLKLTEEANS